MTCDLLWVATGLVSSLHGFGVRGSRPNSTWPPHPEPRTRFQRVKRGMNRGHAGCCKQGVAGGVLVAYGGRDLLYSHTRARKEHSGLLESLLGQYVTQAYAGCLLEQVLQTRLAQVQPGGEIGDPPERGRFDHLQGVELEEKVRRDLGGTDESFIFGAACRVERTLLAHRARAPFGIRGLTVVRRPTTT